MDEREKACKATQGLEGEGSIAGLLIACGVRNGREKRHRGMNQRECSGVESRCQRGLCAMVRATRPRLVAHNVSLREMIASPTFFDCEPLQVLPQSPMRVSTRSAC